MGTLFADLRYGLRILRQAPAFALIAIGLALTGLGLLLGIGSAWAPTGAMKNLLYGVASTDPSTFLVVAALLGIIALIACWAPARRASRVDPIKVPREE